MTHSLLSALPPAPVSTKALLDYLQASGFETKTITHPPLFTVEGSQKLRGTLEGGHTKNLFLKDKKSNYFLLTAQEDSVVNLKTLHKVLGASGRLSFGKPEMMLELLGVAPGSVTAFGIINDRQGKLKFAIDQKLLKHDKINCHPLTNEATTTITRDDLLAFAKACSHDPQIIDLDAEI